MNFDQCVIGALPLLRRVSHKSQTTVKQSTKYHDVFAFRQQ